MAQTIKQANIFGRIGSGFGKGLAEQIPKEIERSRLASGLESLAQDASNLPLFQRFSRLLTIPGMTQQGIQTGGELLRQEGINSALQQRQGRKNPFSNESGDPYDALKKPASPDQPQTGQTPSITTQGPIQATINPYIPKSYEQILDRAGQLASDNRALYQGNPQSAIEAAQTEDLQNQKINQSLQQQRQNQQEVQNRIETDLTSRRQSANAYLPDDVYQPIRDRAIEDVNSGKLTEKQAADKYGKEMDKISREYSDVSAIGNFGVLARSPKENRTKIRNIRDKFKERGDLRNFADTLIAENKISPSKAYYLAYPISDNKELNNYVKNIPIIPTTKVNDSATETLKIAPQLSKLMGKEGSPLGIGEELNNRGYDPAAWLDYVHRNENRLELTSRQSEELRKPQNFYPTINDLWMFGLGLDELEEIE